MKPRFYIYFIKIRKINKIYNKQFKSYIMDNMRKKAEKKAKVMKVETAIFDLGRLTERVTDESRIKRPKYDDVIIALENLTSNDIVCCNLSKLRSLSPIVKNAIKESGIFPAKFNVVCKAIDETIDMYIDTRIKQSKSGKISGQRVREKSNLSNKIDEGLEVVNTIIDEFATVFDNEKGVGGLDIKTAKKLRNLSYKILGLTTKHIDILSKRAINPELAMFDENW
jgi:hypothetical protein